MSRCKARGKHARGVRFLAVLGMARKGGRGKYFAAKQD